MAVLMTEERAMQNFQIRFYLLTGIFLGIVVSSFWFLLGVALVAGIMTIRDMKKVDREHRLHS